MSKELITKLSNLQLREKSLKRSIDNFCYNASVRSRLFDDLKKTQDEIKYVKFQIRLEKEIEDEKRGKIF